MKKIMISMVFVLCAMAISAQGEGSRGFDGGKFFSTEKPDRGITFGIRGGLNSAGLDMKGEDNDLAEETGFGYNAGINVDIPIIKSLYLQSGLFWTVKNAKIKRTDGWKDEYKMNPGFIEIPVLLSYRYDISDKAQLQFNIGPYFAYGVAGKNKSKSGDNDNLFSETKYVDAYGDNREWPKALNPFDGGIKIGTGITFNKFFLGISYEKGFTNIAHIESYSFCDIWDISSVKTRNFSINIGYDF